MDVTLEECTRLIIRTRVSDDIHNEAGREWQRDWDVNRQMAYAVGI